MSATVRAVYEEDPGDAPIPVRVELEVTLNHEGVTLLGVEAVDGRPLTPRQDQEAVERALHHYAREAGLPREWVARIRVKQPPAED